MKDPTFPEGTTKIECFPCHLLSFEPADASEGLLSTRDVRMAGGASTKDATYPFMTAVYRNGEYLCAGVLVQNKYVLTAAHCFIDSVVLAFFHCATFNSSLNLPLFSLSFLSFFLSGQC